MMLRPATPSFAGEIADLSAPGLKSVRGTSDSTSIRNKGQVQAALDGDDHEDPLT